MSGPSLRQYTWHRAIHQAAFHEVEQALGAAERFSVVVNRRPNIFSEVAEVFFEVVEARILAHAAEEERDLYPEWRAQQESLGPVLDELAAEHRELRELVGRLEGLLGQEEPMAALEVMRLIAQKVTAHANHEERVMGSLTPPRESLS